MVEILREPLQRVYRAKWNTPAVCFRICYILALILIPYFIGLASHSFWVKETVYSEQPSVQFKDQILIQLDGSTVDSTVFYRFRIPVVTAYTEDFDNDNVTDIFHVKFKMPVPAGESVQRCRVLMFFNVDIQQNLRLTTEGLAYVDASSGLPGTGVSVYGDLMLRQRGSFPFASTVVQDSVINATAIYDANDLTFDSILSAYSKKNDTTYLAAQSQVWKSGKSTMFEFHAHVHVPRQSFRYRPGAAEVWKFGWVQYVSLFILLWAILSRVQTFVFKNKVVDTYADVEPLLKQKLR